MVGLSNISPILGASHSRGWNLHTPGDRMIMPWHRRATGRVRPLNHCFIEGNLCLYQKTKKKKKKPGREVQPAAAWSGGGQGVWTWIGTKSVSNLLDWEFYFEKSTSRDLWELSSSALGQKINCSEGRQGKPSKSEAPCLWQCGLTGGNVTGCATLQGAWGLHSLCLRRSHGSGEKKSSKAILKTASWKQGKSVEEKARNREKRKQTHNKYDR